VFTLKYVRLYYFDEPDRQGFDFAMDTDPSYSDLAYLAFIGMAYASEARPDRPDVADAARLARRATHRTHLRHLGHVTRRLSILP
jgi:uncharacterized membrane protein